MTAETRLTFFRQSGWMMIATTVSGLLMYAVHIPALAKMPEAEYGVFAALLQLLNLMLIPALGLQTVFTQQNASALSDAEKAELRGTVRAVLLWTFMFWLGSLAITAVMQERLLVALKIRNPAALWMTVLTGLPMLWLPIMQGLLQGSQNFLWLGWASILNGAARFLSVCALLVFFHGQAAGAISGAFLGMAVALTVSGWQTLAIWTGPAHPFRAREWLGRIVPLTLGLGASQVMFAADMVVVQIFFKGDTGLYGAAGTIARGLVLFTAPLAMVMFPKIVQSAARSEKSGVLAQALIATGLLGGAAALGCTLLPELPFRIMNKPSYLPIAPLIPWFAWSMLPLAMANVLIGNFLARSQFRIVPWLLLVAAGYVVTLVCVGKFFRTAERLHDFKLVVQTLGGFNLLLLGLLVALAALGSKRTLSPAK